MTSLQDKIVLILPSRRKDGSKIDEDLRNQVMTELIFPLVRAAGGVQEHHAMGGWLNEEGNMVSEDINVFTMFCDLKKIGGMEMLEQTAVLMKTRLEQESVAFEVSQVLYLV